MNELRHGLSFDEYLALQDRQGAIAAAERAVVEAAKRWFDVRTHRDGYLATAPLALAVQALRELETE